MNLLNFKKPILFVCHVVSSPVSSTQHLLSIELKKQLNVPSMYGCISLVMGSIWSRWFTCSCVKVAEETSEDDSSTSVSLLLDTVVWAWFYTLWVGGFLGTNPGGYMCFLYHIPSWCPLMRQNDHGWRFCFFLLKFGFDGFQFLLVWLPEE